MNIKQDDLSRADVLAALAVHLSEANRQNPDGLSHALPLKALQQPNVTFWTVWSGSDLTGFGALKEIADNHGEIKSVHTVAGHRRKGVSSGLMHHIMSVAKARDYKYLSLETHPTDGYAAARALYERLGFEYCKAFGDYEDHPNSVFMTLAL